MKKVIVIGAGASGIMAAITAASKGCDVTVLEGQPKPLKKLLLTGNGRCNFTNLDWTDKTVIRSGNAEKAFDIINSFDCNGVISFFRKLGIESKEHDGWVYPLNESAAAVAKLLLYRAEELKIKIKTNQKVVSVESLEDGGFLVHTQDWKYEADSVIISTGSCARTDNSDCDIVFDTANRYKIKCRPFLPAITSLKSNKKGLAKWSGVRVDGAIELFNGNEKITCAKGQLQLTEYGISGIPVFEISRYAVELLNKESKNDIYLKMDFMPDKELTELQNDIADIKTRFPGRNTKTILLGFLNERLADFIASKNGNIEDCISDIKSFCMPISGYMGMDKAQACIGGIDIDELTDALEARKCPGLYFTGEAVDVDGKCGGYNLQWAWSSGYAAGNAACK